MSDHDTSPHVIVLGLGYVGLPLAVALAGRFATTGLDIDASRIAELRRGHDRTGEIDGERLGASTLALIATPADCPPAMFYLRRGRAPEPAKSARRAA